LLEEVRDYSAPIILERRHGCLEAMIRQTWSEILEAKGGTNAPQFILGKTADFPRDCFMDYDRFRQVIRNLLENAFDASDEQGEIWVQLSITEHPNSILRIEVTDSGAGVSEDNLETIFNPFFTTKTKGTGLGLAVSRRYVEAHDGQIFVDGSHGKGAKFVVQVPHRQR
jgi:signal transduction histidine kinase